MKENIVGIRKELIQEFSETVIYVARKIVFHGTAWNYFIICDMNSFEIAVTILKYLFCR
jgi:hypothetical protein